MDKILGVDIGSLTVKAATYDPYQNRAEELEVVSHGRQPFRKSLPLLAKWMKDPKISRIAFTGVKGEELAEYLGGVKDVNEITAHRTGSQTIANRLKLSFDEIFEIGGQDSKYMKGIEQFDMNKSCAAGTGSFLEEQAKHLGVKIKDFSSLALKAKTPVSFGNKKCTVFIEEELSAMQGKMCCEDLLASAVYAVAENFLSQFKIGDKKGKTIFFQGGVALNHAVAAAFNYFTRAQIIVPEHNEVMGAIGAAIYSRKNYSATTPFVSLEKVGKRQHSVTSQNQKNLTLAFFSEL